MASAVDKQNIIHELHFFSELQFYPVTTWTGPTIADQQPPTYNFNPFADSTNFHPEPTTSEAMSPKKNRTPTKPSKNPPKSSEDKAGPSTAGPTALPSRQPAKVADANQAGPSTAAQHNPAGPSTAGQHNPACPSGRPSRQSSKPGSSKPHKPFDRTDGVSLRGKKKGVEAENDEANQAGQDEANDDDDEEIARMMEKMKKKQEEKQKKKERKAREREQQELAKKAEEAKKQEEEKRKKEQEEKEKAEELKKQKNAKLMEKARERLRQQGMNVDSSSSSSSEEEEEEEEPKEQQKPKDQPAKKKKHDSKEEGGKNRKKKRNRVSSSSSEAEAETTRKKSKTDWAIRGPKSDEDEKSESDDPQANIDTEEEKDSDDDGTFKTQAERMRLKAARFYRKNLEMGESIELRKVRKIFFIVSAFRKLRLLWRVVRHICRTPSLFHSLLLSASRKISTYRSSFFLFFAFIKTLATCCNSHSFSIAGPIRHNGRQPQGRQRPDRLREEEEGDAYCSRTREEPQGIRREGGERRRASLSLPILDARPTRVRAINCGNTHDKQ